MKLAETHYSRTNINQRTTSSRSLLRVKNNQLGGGFKNCSSVKENLSCLSKSPFSEKKSVMSTQVGSFLKVENEENQEILAKVWNCWKRLKLEKEKKVQLARKKLLKFLRQRKKFLKFISAQFDKKLKIKSFFALKTLKSTKIPPKKIFLKKFLKAWNQRKNSAKKLYQVSFVLHEKTCQDLEKKLFFIWKNKLKILRLSSDFLKNLELKSKGFIFSFLKNHSKLEKNKRKLVKRLVFQKTRTIFSMFFFKWYRFSSYSRCSSMTSKLSSLKSSNFLQECEIKELRSKLSELSKIHQLFHEDSESRENDLKLLLKRHAEELYKSICS